MDSTRQNADNNTSSSSSNSSTFARAAFHKKNSQSAEKNKHKFKSSYTELF